MVPEDSLDEEELQQALAEGAIIRTDYSSRLIYTELDNQLIVYANGQPLEDISDAEAKLLKRLADAESLTYEDFLAAELSIETVMSWLENSWVWLDF